MVLRGNNMNNERISKDEYYLNIARECSRRGTCLQRNFGAIIVKCDQIISTGYTGAPRDRKNCCDIGTCERRKNQIPRGTRYDLCRSVHAEMNAIIHPSRDEMIGSIMYLCGIEMETGKVVNNAKPCKLCKALIINSGISKVKVLIDESNFKTYKTEDWIKNDETLNIQGSDIGY